MFTNDLIIHEQTAPRAVCGEHGNALFSANVHTDPLNNGASLHMLKRDGAWCHVRLTLLCNTLRNAPSYTEI